MKDNFSTQSDSYARYRPAYPATLFGYLTSLVAHRENAWDCGTGSGQIAFELASSFGRVYATDISTSQLEHALPHQRIEYSVQPAENTSFPTGFFDLITVAQAIHWFDFGAFYQEVNRTIRPGGVLAVIGYNLIRISPAVDAVLDRFYRDVVGPFWDKERRYIDERYQTIPFPYEEIASPVFINEVQWTFEHLIGYIGTWSAVKHYEKLQGKDPVDLVREELQNNWGEAHMKTGWFPILLRVAIL